MRRRPGRVETRRKPDIDDFERIRRERLNLADEMAGLTADEWNTQSLCAEWRVADVVAHVLASTDMRFRLMFGRLVKSGFSLDRTLSKQARELGELPQAELVGSLRARADFRFVPPGAKPTNLMADTVVHSQDIRRPLGIPCGVEASTLLVAAFVEPTPITPSLQHTAFCPASQESASLRRRLRHGAAAFPKIDSGRSLSR